MKSQLFKMLKPIWGQKLPRLVSNVKIHSSRVGSPVSLLYFVFFMAMSQIIVPISGEHNDLFIFSAWNLFSFPPSKEVYDVFDSSRDKYLFRDDVQWLKVNVNTISGLNAAVRNYDISWIEKDYCSVLLRWANNQPVSIHKLEGTFTDFILYKKELVVSKSNELCNVQ